MKYTIGRNLLLAMTTSMVCAMPAISSSEDVKRTQIAIDVPYNTPLALAFRADAKGTVVKLNEMLLEQYNQRKCFDSAFLTVKMPLWGTLQSKLEDDAEGTVALVEELLQKHDAQVQFERDLAEGKFPTLRRMAASEAKPKHALKWHFVEMLLSFGESYDYKAMRQLSTQLHITQVDSALELAGIWVADHFYNGRVDTLNYPKEPTLEATFKKFFSHGQIESFYYWLDMNCIEHMPRVSYLDFFLHLGVENVNLGAAWEALRGAAQTKHTASRVLFDAISLLRHPNYDVARTDLLLATMNSKRPVLQHIYSLLTSINGVGEVNAPTFGSQKDIIKHLRRTLKI